jgi:CO/xanthine dehydrogenase FAD-binding subunit
MKADPREFDLVVPASLDEALAALAADPSRRPLAGGTDLMVLFAMGKLPWQKLIGLWRCAALRGIRVEPGAIVYGALTTYTEVQAHAETRAELPMLVAAAAETGGLAIQNRGTLGGNLANASPAADSSPPLLAYDAELELVSAAGGRRTVKYAAFHTGYKTTLLRPGELIAAVRVPRAPAGTTRTHVFEKVGPRKAQAISKICLAACVERPGGGGPPTAVRLAFGGVAATVVRAPRAEAALAAGDLRGAQAALAQDLAPIDDIRSTARYRLRVAKNRLPPVG